ncbi:calcium-binding protein (plasmid) [Leptolyngbya boryana IU 594]|nr:calcium-binding protein [Leptolyngbya sp. FACHB-238]MBD2397356.1 calcium-binding protein [Leptolyngbya sp. FACHB-239]MBD2403839.1 calcium-binding protein [Leptolyngbya sp. FACHB-402]ULP33534.1 calcium-binding protein [Leptolyngbya boryana IU 594]
MGEGKRDEEREERITMEVVVDAYGSEEQAMGWYYYLQDTMQFPFTAICVSKRRISPLREGTTVEGVGMAPEDECEQEMFVKIDCEGDTLGVPLIQLEAPEADAETQQANTLCEPKAPPTGTTGSQGYEFG